MHVLRARRDYKLTLLSAPRLASRGTNLVCLMKSFVWPRPKKLRPLSDEFEMRQHDKFYFVVQKIM